jgi:glycosyltransferase involved in cell wall biosynthesis
MSNPLLTVAVPVFNGGNPLLEAIDSCRNITLPKTDFEVLIVDNCSTDGMVEQCIEKYKNLLPLRVVRNNVNCGRINNWNRCLELADGDYILYLFANDLIAKTNSIETALSLFKKNMNCALISSPWIISNFNCTFQKQEPEFLKRSPGFGFFAPSEHIKKVIESGKLPFVCLQSCFLQKKLIIQNRLFFDEKIPLTTDGVFLCNLAYTTHEIGFINDVTMIFRFDAPNRQHSNVILHEHIEQMISAFIQIKNLSKNVKINLTLACSNFSGLENAIVYIFRNPTKSGFKYLLKMYQSWKVSIYDADLNWQQLRILVMLRIMRLPFKAFSYLAKIIFK